MMQKVLIASICAFAFVAGSQAGLADKLKSANSCEWIDTKPTATVKTVATEDGSVLTTFGTYLQFGNKYLKLDLIKIANETDERGPEYLTFQHDCAKMEMTFDEMHDDKFRLTNLEIRLSKPIGGHDYYQFGGDPFQVKTTHYKCDKQQTYTIYNGKLEMKVVVPQFEYEFGGDVAAHKQGKFSTPVLSSC